MKQPGVTFHGMVGHMALSEALASSGVLAYPTSFPEISCITAMKAQVALALVALALVALALVALILVALILVALALVALILVALDLVAAGCLALQR